MLCSMVISAAWMVTTGLMESNRSILLGLWLSPAYWLPRHWDWHQPQCSCMGVPLPFYHALHILSQLLFNQPNVPCSSWVRLSTTWISQHQRKLLGLIARLDFLQASCHPDNNFCPNNNFKTVRTCEVNELQQTSHTVWIQTVIIEMNFRWWSMEKIFTSCVFDDLWKPKKCKGCSFLCNGQKLKLARGALDKCCKLHNYKMHYCGQKNICKQLLLQKIRQHYKKCNA